MRGIWLTVLLSVGAYGGAAAEPAGAEQLRNEGRSLILRCEFKRAARLLERAVVVDPGSALSRHWLGTAYARIAESAGPLSAPRFARKARHNLELAVRLEPRNREYRAELFDFYVDSPEWGAGSLEMAANILERFSTDDPNLEPRARRLAESRKDHSGVAWRWRQAVLWTAGAAGYVLPLR